MSVRGESVEVLVVGAGPAGSHAALRLAEAGREVLLVEKRPEIGNPVRCAEAAELAVLRSLIGEPERGWEAATVYGARGIAPDGHVVTYVGERPVGVVLNRRLFDRGLAARAADAGAAVAARLRAGVPEKTTAGWSVELRGGGSSRSLHCRVLVIAEGVESWLVNVLGLAGPWIGREMHSCAQARVVGLTPEERPLIDFHLGSEVAPGGYAWRFPTGPDTANVGVCLHPDRQDGPGEARRRLERLLESRFPEARSCELACGTIPAPRRPRRLTDDNLVVIGDAAAHAEPLSGGGIANALQGAELAAGVIARALEDGDCSRRALAGYEEAWAAGVGRSLRRYHKLRRFYLSLEDRDFNDLLRLLDRQLERWRDGESGTVLSLLTSVMKSSPRLLLKARHLL